jgi:hypothetical protein
VAEFGSLFAPLSTEELWELLSVYRGFDTGEMSREMRDARSAIIQELRNRGIPNSTIFQSPGAQVRDGRYIDPGLHQDPSDVGSDPTIFRSRPLPVGYDTTQEIEGVGVRPKAPPLSTAFTPRVAPTQGLPSSEFAQLVTPTRETFVADPGPGVDPSDNLGGSGSGLLRDVERVGGIPVDPSLIQGVTTPQRGITPAQPAPVRGITPAPVGGAPAAQQKPSNLATIGEGVEMRGSPLQKGAKTMGFYPQEVDGRTVEVIQYRNPGGRNEWLHVTPTAAGEHKRIGQTRG